MLKNLFVSLNLGVLISCSEKFSVIITSLESYSELVSSILQIPSESNLVEISVNELVESSNKLFAGECDNYNINYSGKSAKIAQNSNYDTSTSPGFLDVGKKESLQPQLAFTSVKYQH